MNTEIENTGNDSQDVVAETSTTSPFPEANRAPEVGGDSVAAAQDAEDPALPIEFATAELATVLNTQGFFTACVPTPTAKNFHVQLGCHIEEVVETLKSFTFKNQDRNNQLRVSAARLEKLADELKSGKGKLASVDWDAFIDGMADTRVTAIGAIHMTGYNVDGVIDEIDGSNDSKLVDGKPVFDDNGKIKKGPGYFKPNLARHAPAGGVTVLG